MTVESTTFLYVIGQPGTPPVKIGLAKNVEERIRILQTGMPIELSNLFSLAVEADIARKAEMACHRYLGHSMARGEWFNVSAEVAADAIQHVIASRLWERPSSSMTLDDQLRALQPLKPGQIADLAGYSSGSNQLTAFRGRGSTIPAERLRAVARRLREIAEAAEEIAGR